MNCKWNRKTDEEGLKNLINTMFPIYIYYLKDRGYNLTCIEYQRNLIPILKSGIITEELIEDLSWYIKTIEEELNISEEDSILNKLKNKKMERE